MELIIPDENIPSEREVEPEMGIEKPRASQPGSGNLGSESQYLYLSLFVELSDDDFKCRI